MDAFYFVNNVVVYKALLIKENGGKVVYGYRPGSPWGRPYGLSYSCGGEGGKAQAGEKAQRWGGFKTVRTP